MSDRKDEKLNNGDLREIKSLIGDADSGGFSLFQLADHFYKTRAIHRHAGNAVIQKMNQICVTLFLCDFGKQFLLIADAVAFAFKIIVTGKPLIEEGCHVTGFFVVRLSH